MLRKSQPSTSHSYVSFIKSGQFIASKKKRLASFFIRAFLLACIIAPASAKAQEAGCMDSEILYVKINTVPPAITATAANFSNCSSGNYTYQWQVSTDNIHYTDLPGATSQNLNYTQPLTETLYFLRKATCGNITKYTNSVTVYPVYTACEDFGLSLAGTSGNAVATIKAGLVTTTTSSTIGEFVIEWYRETVDGTPEFTSGSAGSTDPAVTVSHPFEGEPAEGGTWHPVIKYVYIDGIKYSRDAMTGARHSPDLLNCLDPIVVIVDNLTCSNGGSYFASNGANYIHKVSYTNGLVSPTLASRSLRFDLDATNKFFAWFFEGNTVADNLKITYVSPANSTSTVLEYWKIGIDAGGNDVTVSPKLWTTGRMYKIISLNQFVFAAGDYLRIEITPGANSNTNWNFYCKCFATMNCDIWDSSVRSIQSGSVAMTWNSSLCQYEVVYNRATPWTNPTSDFALYNYHSYYPGSGGADGVYPFQSGVKLILKKNTTGNTFATHPFWNCSAQSGSSTISKNGNVVTAVFSNVDDYNYHKSSYQAALASADMTNYSSNNTLINYYKIFVFHFIVANSCGDNRVDKYFYTHYSNPPVFDDATKTITLNLASLTDNYSLINSCDNTPVNISGLISNIDAGINEPDFSSTTNVSGAAYPISGIYVTQTSIDETASPRTFAVFAGAPGIDACDLSAKGWSNTRGLNANQWQFDLIWDKLTITNTADPINNFKLERLMNNDGVPLSPGNYITVYEIINGVVQ